MTIFVIQKFTVQYHLILISSYMYRLKRLSFKIRQFNTSFFKIKIIFPHYEFTVNERFEF